MKLNVRYPTKERVWHCNETFSYVQKDTALDAVKILRTPCGRGAASNRFNYEAIFPAPSDAAFAFRGLIRANIVRKKNPHFKPSTLDWDGFVACVAGLHRGLTLSQRHDRNPTPPEPPR